MSSRTEDRGVHSRSWRTALLATVALAAVLRLVGLESGLWYDEIITLVESGRRPLGRILADFSTENTHPLYSLFAHESIRVFGESAWALRLPAAIFGIASIVMTYVLAARLTARSEAWAAAAILTASYHHVWFSQNARGYTLMGFLTLFATFFLLRAGHTRQRADYVAYALACAAGIYTHLTMAFVVAGHAAVILGGRALRWRPAMRQPLRPALVAWTGAVVLSVAAYAPVAQQVVGMVRSEPSSAAAEVASAGWAVAEVLRSMIVGVGGFVTIALGVLAILGTFSLWRRQPLAVALLIVPGVVTAAALVALNYPIRPRFFFFLSGAAAIFAARGIGAVSDRLAFTPVIAKRAPAGAIVVVGTLALTAASAAGLPRNYQVPKQDFDGAVRFLDAAEREGARIGASGLACLPLEIYYARTDWPCLRGADDWRTVDTAAPARVLIVYTLAEYIRDPALAGRLEQRCPVVRRFPGTLGGGDLIVCEAAPDATPE